jgi:hypothetical protein
MIYDIDKTEYRRRWPGRRSQLAVSSDARDAGGPRCAVRVVRVRSDPDGGLSVRLYTVYAHLRDVGGPAVVGQVVRRAENHYKSRAQTVQV